MNTMRQQAARLVKQLHKSQQIRRMSSGKIDKAVEEKEMKKWKIITFGAMPFVAAKFIYDFTQSHDHGEEPPAYPYMQIRNKEFPWGNDNLFTKKHHDH